MNSLRRNILAMIIAALISFSLGIISGCMTVRGIASDIKVTAGALEKSLEPIDQSRK